MIQLRSILEVADIGVAISEQDVAETVPTKITKA